MKKLMFILFFAMFCIGTPYAQEYKVAKNSGRLWIREVNHVTVEGYDGNEIVFTSRNHDRGDDQRAKGLRALSSLGLEDNTGLGLSVKDTGDYIEVQQLKKTEGPEIDIMVPHDVLISYVHSSPYGDEINIKNFKGEIQASTVHNGVVVTNTSGPMSIKTVHGDIDVSFATAPSALVTLESVHGHVDIALPISTKADLTLSTNWGEVLVDPDLKIVLDKQGEFVEYSGKIKGKLNGGGIKIFLTSQHNNVYLRKKG